jgi:mono/diheme cytochrome c family protein
VADLPESDALADWVEAGRQAFERYPINVDPGFRSLRNRPNVALDHGLAVDASGVVRGVVEVQLSNGDWAVALTCAACHSSPDDQGFVVPGVANSRLRFAELMGAAIWPAGVMDVTGDEIENPVAPPDLRPLRHQVRMHHSGNLLNGRIERMVRIETLMMSRQAFGVRPNRTLVAAMALYLESLADALPTPDEASAGAAVFEGACSSCHQGDAMSGAPVMAGLVGTSSAATIGSSRETGGYRAPSLLGVRDRGSLLHDGSAPNLEALLGLEASEHVGHPFGTDLSESDRLAIIDYLTGP